MLKQILEKNPNTKFVYFKRVGGQFVGDIIDVPLKHVEITMKVNPMWILVSTTEQMDADIADLFTDDKLAPTADLVYDKDKLDIPPLPAPVTDKEFDKVMGKDVGLPIGVAKKRKYTRRKKVIKKK